MSLVLAGEARCKGFTWAKRRCRTAGMFALVCVLLIRVLLGGAYGFCVSVSVLSGKACKGKREHCLRFCICVHVSFVDAVLPVMLNPYVFTVSVSRAMKGQ